MCAFHVFDENSHNIHKTFSIAACYTCTMTCNVSLQNCFSSSVQTFYLSVEVEKMIQALLISAGIVVGTLIHMWHLFKCEVLLDRTH